MLPGALDEFVPRPSQTNPRRRKCGGNLLSDVAIYDGGVFKLRPNFAANDIQGHGNLKFKGP